MSLRPYSIVKFATDAAASQIVEPPTHIRENGFATGTRPPAQWMNYMFANLAQWVDRLRGPSRREWTRYEIAATELGMPAVDPVTNPENLTSPARRMIVLKGTGDRVLASVRGTALTELTMVSGPDTAVLAACATNDGWLVGGAHTATTQGRIVGTTFDPDPGSAVKTPAIAWTVHTIPALMRAVHAIVARTSGPQAGDAVAVIDDDEILVRTGPTTWAYATTSLPLGGNGSDVCDTGEQWVFVDTSGNVFRSSWPSAITFAAVSAFSGGGAWRLACDDRGTVVAYRAGEPSPEDWYISTDHGLTWSSLDAPPYTNITRIRYIDGTWLLGSADWPHVAESNDLEHWQACPVPHADGASMRINDFVELDGAIIAVGSNHWLRGARGEIVAPGPWSPAGPSLPIADAGYLQGRAIEATAPTSGQVLAWDAGALKWTPTTVLPAGTNGGVLAYSGGAWASTAAGAAGQVLTSNGSGAASWGQIVLPLTQRVIDVATSAVSVGARVAHDLSAGVGAAGIGSRIELSVCNSAGDVAPIAAIDAVATDVAVDAEVGVLDVVLANAGGAVDTRALRVSASSLSTYTGAAWVQLFGRISGEWIYGSTDAANGGNAVLQAPSSGAGLYLRRGSTNHLAINSAGTLTLGTTSHETTLQGSALTIGLSSVVALYQGGARVPETTISSSATLDASHEVVFVDTTGGSVTLTLPAGASGRVLAVQRIAGTNNVIVQPAGSDTLRVGGTGALTSWTINDDARHGLIYRSAATEWVVEA